MKRFINILLVASLVALTGCLTLEQRMRFKDDGTLLVTYTCNYPAEQEEAIQAAMEELLAHKGFPKASFTDKASMEVFYAAHGAEMTLHRKTVRDGTVNIQMIVIARQTTKALAQGAFGEMLLKPVDEKVRLEIPLPEISPDLKRRAQKLCKDFKTTLVIETPGKIIGHNGKQLDSDKVSWTYGVEDTPPRELFAEWSE